MSDKDNAAPVFEGFDAPEQNWSKLPHIFIQHLSDMKSESEIKCVLYILRHTWGFSEFDKPKHMTTDEFMNGRKKSDGTRLDKGTGLTKPSVIKGLRDAAAHGFIVVSIGDDSDGGRIEKLYSLNMRKESLPHESIPLTPDVKILYPSEELPSMGKESLQIDALRGKDSLHRTEKETKDKKYTEDSATVVAIVPKAARKKHTSKPKAPSPHEPEFVALVKANNLDVETMLKAKQGATSYWLVAAELHRTGFPIDRVGELYIWVKDKARREGWKSLTVNAMGKYAQDFLRDNPVMFSISSAQPPVYTAPAALREAMEADHAS